MHLNVGQRCQFLCVQIGWCGWVGVATRKRDVLVGNWLCYPHNELELDCSSLQVPWYAVVWLLLALLLRAGYS